MMSASLLTGPIIPMASVCGLVLAGVLVSLLTLWRAQAVLRGARHNAGEPNTAGLESAIGVLQEKLESLKTQVQETRQYAHTAVPPGPPRAGLNLDKRSQALRMHRRGEPAAQIAATLELPRQEVELLLKVHRVVIRSI
jgi:hypothetical protein